MKTLALLLALGVSTVPAFAESVSLFARGQAFGSCDQATFDTCALLLKQQARRDAEQDLNNQCYGRSGRLMAPFCSDSCSPISAPPPPSPVPIFTSCTADCQASCYLD